MPYKAIAFDVDGTLVDTRRFVDVLELAYHETYPQRPRLPYADFVRCYPMNGPRIFQTLGVPEEERPMMQQHIRRIEKEMGLGMELFDGMEETAAALHQSGYALGINTSRTKDVFRLLLTEHNQHFWELFTIRITDDLAARPKPAPDSLQLFCQMAGLPPEQVLFVGDSIFDSQCAQGAGCDFAAAGWGAIEGAQDELLPAQYHPAAPQDLLAILAQHG